MSRNPIRFGVALALIAFGVTLRAHAGVVVTTAHPISINLKPLNQTTNTSGDLRFERHSTSTRDAFAICVGQLPTKTQAIYLFLTCQNLDDNQIMAIDTNPVSGLVGMGSIDFDLEHRVDITKNGVLKASSIPVQISLVCNAGDTEVEASGIMDITFSALGQLDACPDSAHVRMTGRGHNEPSPGDFIVDDGSSITVRKRSSTITSVPAL